MIIRKSYKFRLYPTEEQLSILKQHGGSSRFVWNQLLNFSNNYKESHNNQYPSKIILQKQIVELKKDHEFIKLCHSQPLQINASRLAETFKKAFSKKVIRERMKKIAIAERETDPIKKAKKLEKANNCGFPQFKSKHRHNDSLFYPQYYKIEKDHIVFSKIGSIKFIKHREVEGKPKFVTIVQDCDQYYVSITSELNVEEKKKMDLEKANIIGIDLGLKEFATFSDGTIIGNPRHLKKYLKRLKKENQNLSRKVFEETDRKTINNKVIKKSSNNRNKNVRKVQQLHKKIRNVRKDFLHKLTHNMIAKYDGFILEDLNIKGMMKNHKLAKSISDVSWSEYERQLAYKSEWSGKYFIKIDRFEASSKTCSKCGWKNEELTLKDRVFICKECGLVIDRDSNASINIKRVGMELLNTTATVEINACGGTLVPVKQEKLEDINYLSNL